MESKNGTFDLPEDVKDEIKTRACPSIDGALPSWPTRIKEKAEWIGLHEKEFIYTHHSSHGDRIEDEKLKERSTQTEKKKKKDKTKELEKRSEALFCVPFPESQRLLSILRNTKGGSILVTGYRGTGKSSLVNYTISKLIDETREKDQKGKDKYKYVPIRINLSTSRTAMDLVMMMITELHHCSDEKRFRDKESEMISRMYERFIEQKTRQSTESRGHTIESGIDGIPPLPVIGRIRIDTSTSTGTSFQEYPYTLHEAQIDLHRCLKRLSSHGYRIIFILDELDKLTPPHTTDPTSPYSQKLQEIQTIVSDLKFLLTEANAFHIFIAGKDVDDSWQEDQNKGEGLFESIFVQNIYLPSTFTARLKPTVGPHKWIEKFYILWRVASDIYQKFPKKANHTGEYILSKIFNKRKFKRKFKKRCKKLGSEIPDEWIEQIYLLLLNELGISPKNWTYNTGLLILPHFSEKELFKLFLRSCEREREAKGEEPKNIPDKFIKFLGNSVGEKREEQEAFISENGVELMYLVLKLTEQNEEYKGLPEYLKEHIPPIPNEPMSERRCRRIHYLLQYLTYKGRGIPRKILREFYALVQDRRIMWEGEVCSDGICGIDYIIYEPTAVRQKIKFFANIVTLLESNQDIFRYLDDKGCVATFHIIDYILKFYQTGFTWSDIESASFMTLREELFPSRQLVDTILEILEGHVITRIERRHKVYGLLPRLKHDLTDLYLAFGPEQIELRFTKADFSSEKELLLSKIREVENTSPENRLESFKTQLRIAKLDELLGNSQEAIREYSKALRWIRVDINRMLPEENQPADALNRTAIITYLSTAVDTLQKVGYLYELNSEFNNALHYYQSAVQLIESSWEFDFNNESSILGERMKPSPIKGKVIQGKQKKPDRQKLKKFDQTLKDLVDPMIPGKPEQINLFTRQLDYSQISFTESGATPYPVYSGFEPVGLPNIINSIAVVMEKLWHRCSSNRFMLLALDLYRQRFDEHKVIEQMIFIGEMHMRRRDIRMAASWYILALKRQEKYQKCDPRDCSSKQTGVRSTTRAKLFDYLGDIYYATDGTALLDSKYLRKFIKKKNGKNLNKQILNEVKTLRESLKMSVLDEREPDDETEELFFYTEAAYHYGVNHQTLSVCDVYLKSLVVRFEKLFKILKKNSEDLKYAETCWRLFWKEAEKILNILLDTRPYIKKIQPLGKGRIINQRRFGELFTIIGRMFMLMSHSELSDWFWVGEKVEMEEPVSRIDRIIGHLIDNEDFEKGMGFKERNIRIRQKLCEKDCIRNRSPLWNLASLKWRGIGKERETNSEGSLDRCLTQQNAFMVGQLYCLCDNFLKDGSNKKQQKDKVIMLFFAELSLLGAHLALDDNLRDLESAHTSHRLGGLYLHCIEFLLGLRHRHLNGNGIRNPDAFDHALALVYSSLHLAAKRFLVNAIDIYRAEHRHTRCTHNELGRAYRALGDLMVIRAEILEFEKNKKSGGDRKTTFPGLEKGWNELLDSLELQKKHVADEDPSDARHQAAENYRDACRQYLSEIEDYMKRYRFPTNVYFPHKDIMDEKMHFEICQSIYIRHWDYKASEQKEAKDAVAELKKIANELTDVLYDPLPRVGDRMDWLRDMHTITGCVNRVSPTGGHIIIEEPDNEKKPKYSVKWIENGEASSGENAAGHFFRSFDDGLGVLTKAA